MTTRDPEPRGDAVSTPVHKAVENYTRVIRLLMTVDNYCSAAIRARIAATISSPTELTPITCTSVRRGPLGA